MLMYILVSTTTTTTISKRIIDITGAAKVANTQPVLWIGDCKLEKGEKERKSATTTIYLELSLSNRTLISLTVAGH